MCEDRKPMQIGEGDGGKRERELSEVNTRSVSLLPVPPFPWWLLLEIIMWSHIYCVFI
jgi:hypothetical protein